MKMVTTKFKSGGLHEKHVVATWNLGIQPGRDVISTDDGNTSDKQLPRRK